MIIKYFLLLRLRLVDKTLTDDNFINGMVNKNSQLIEIKENFKGN